MVKLHRKLGLCLESREELRVMLILSFHIVFIDPRGKSETAKLKSMIIFYNVRGY